MPNENPRRRDRLLLAATLLWIAGLPTYWILANQVMPSIPVLKAERLAYLVVAVLLVYCLARRDEWGSIRAVDVGVAAYLAVALASWLSTVPGKGVVELKQDGNFLLTCFLMPCTAYWTARTIEWTWQRVIRCLWVLVGGVGTFLVVVGLAQAMFDWGFLVAAAFTEHPEQSKGTFENAVVNATVLGILLMPTLFLYLQARRRWTRWLLIALAVALMQDIVTAKARVVWIAAPVVLGLVALRIPRLRLLAAILATGLAAQVLLAPSVGVDPWGLRPRMTETMPLYHRAGVGATAVNMIQHRPLFGFGLGMNTFRREKPDYYDSWGGLSKEWAEYPGHPHNEFLNVMVLMGIVGLAAYVAFLATSLWALGSVAARQRETNPGAAQLAVVTLAALLLFVITGQSHDVMYMSYPQVLVFFLLGIAVTTPTVPLLERRR